DDGIRDRNVTGVQTCALPISSYIPQLKKANPNHLGIVLIGNNGLRLRSGDVNIPFTNQSISKVFSLIVACMQRGIEQVLNYVNVEPTGEDFDSIMHLEMNRPKKPFNPFIRKNARLSSHCKSRSL